MASAAKLASSGVSADMKIRPLPLVITVVLVPGCAAGQATTHPRSGQVSPGTSPALSQHPCLGPPSGLPATIQAIPFRRPQSEPGIVQPGTQVPKGHVGLHAAATSRLVFGLADVAGQGGPDTYPAISTDGGRNWRIDGPRFRSTGAQGAGVANHIGAGSPAFAYVWGNGGNAVRVTTDAGRHWQVTDFPAGVHNVYWSHGQLNTQALGSTLPDGKFPTCLYASPDQGRTWIFRHQLATVSRP